ncbi:MAG: PepSY domain-containing protein, partial [Oscillospiraceae bacterium]
MKTNNIKSKSKRNLLMGLSAAAALMLVAGCAFGYTGYKKGKTIDSVIALDVNPSIEMKINKSEKVIAIDALNSDAKKIIGDMDLKGTKLDVTVNAIIGSMLKTGYISKDQNSVLVSVQNDDAPKCQELEKKLTDEIKEILKTNSVEGSVMTQTTKADEELAKLAKENNISLGKAKLIQTMAKQNNTFTFEELAKMSINDLKLLSESQEIDLDDIVTTGEASDKAYIGKEKAESITLSHANVSKADAKKMDIELDCEKGVMVYDVDFDTTDFEYDYQIDAVTGQIVNSKKVANKTEEEKQKEENDKNEDKDDEKTEKEDEVKDEEDDKDAD